MIIDVLDEEGAMEGVDNAAVAARLRILAEQVGGATALARLLDLHRSTVFDYLSGVREVPAVRFHLIAARYPCDLDWLLYGHGTPPDPDPNRTLEANRPKKRKGDAAVQPAPVAMKESNWRVTNAILNSTYGAGPDIRLKKAGEQVRALIGMATPETMEKIKAVLGPELLQLVLDHRAVPEDHVLAELASSVGVTTVWLTGLGE